ncbi:MULTISPECIES: FtsW/RodA/SpoVE family cell cycle protein [unclassified Breznakia]|uniref:FtsW/RodA/SpoVE family cell cycle protein n=1 Tax=unclassified Breznakia TaxID=2623764 RepID=UPI0024762521|nr:MULTISPECIES: FtsW/RodA/SpoVE family cell cycle protein [unclassified Breznakia]MDH6366801.1 cell division protein FtsW [Breznakia sp. PH1-1]MDH6403812.1 cell division protein FtsW [Breznakia sp. PF1-11]MDH6411521.1 cell division protein FtsW [Breznakia sp. PFB1-11]MDH6413885.1 cell division protein FtsW [Breznakia sp. PFB1-14]MDH6416314.1 cell division protein FtsW [Breznakia sp. PFB1-4]
MDFILQLIEPHYLRFARYVFVLLAFLIFIEIKRLILYRQEKQRILAVLNVGNGVEKIPITNYEVTIGRASTCDVIINLRFISKQHAVLVMNDDGYWNLTDTRFAGDILVNDQKADDQTPIHMGDTISLSGVEMVIQPPTYDNIKAYEEKLHKQKKRLSFKFMQRLKFIGRKDGSYAKAMVLLNIFQILTCIQMYFAIDATYHKEIFLSFGALFILPWLCIPIGKMLKLKNLGAEAAAFFLTTIGFSMIASANPQDVYKQLFACIIGIVLYIILCLALQNLDTIMKLRRYAALLSILILAFTLVFGSNINGQTNWIRLGPLSLQTSELVKVLFIFASSATLNWLFKSKNLRNLIVYSTACVGLLFLMGDFGTALIFFVTFIILMFMTSGDIKAIFMTLLVSGLGGLMVLSFRPYIMRRFETWRHVFAHMYDSGYQQASALIALASGGLLGLGVGNGFAKNIFAADTDIVIAMIGEEWGLLIAIMVAIMFLVILLGAIRSHKVARSSYYVIAACAAAGMFVIQAALNIFGALDVLPFTGVTLPFVSNGGSSIVGSWGLLSFISASLNYATPNEHQEVKPVDVGGEE